MLELSVESSEESDKTSMQVDIKDLLLVEYESCREGLRSFDSYMFRVRQWNATATAALAAAAFEFDSDMLFVGIFLSVIFWYYDAMQKSLQLILIIRSREIEKVLSSPFTGESYDYAGIQLGRRFEENHNKHIVDAFGCMFEQSVFPFYVMPIAGCVVGLLYLS